MQVVRVDTKRFRHDLVKGLEDDSSTLGENCATNYFPLYCEVETTKNHGSIECYRSRQEGNFKRVRRMIYLGGRRGIGCPVWTKVFHLCKQPPRRLQVQRRTGLYAAKDMSDLKAIIQYLTIANNLKPQSHKFWSILLHKNGVRFDTPTTSQIETFKLRKQ